MQYRAERGHPCENPACFHASCVVMRGAGRVAEGGPSDGDLLTGASGDRLRETLEPPTVKRARFTAAGEVLTEDTHATEGERAPVQAELGIGAGEQPISTAGPLFAEADAEEAQP